MILNTFIVKLSLNYWYTSLRYLKGNSLVIIISMSPGPEGPSYQTRLKHLSFWRSRSAFPGLRLGEK